MWKDWEEAIEHGFYGLVFHMWRRESNQESVGDAQDAITILFSQLALKGGGAISMKLIISWANKKSQWDQNS